MQAAEHVPSPFVTTLILHCLHSVADPRMEGVTSKALDFVELGMEPPGVWRFWSMGSELRTQVPPDLDDTCCASYVLRLYNRQVPANQDLILAHVAPDQRFYTWVAPRNSLPLGLVPNPETLLWLSLYDQWGDVDPVVNANVVLFLGESSGTTGALTYLLDTLSNTNHDTCSRYYPDALSLYYMLVRAHVSSAPSLRRGMGLVANRTLARQHSDGSFGNALQTAMAASVLLNLDENRSALERAVSSLINSQQATGAWPAAPLFVDPNRYYGASELTTAVCLEALSTYARA